MKYNFLFTSKALKTFYKFDKYVQKILLKWIEKNLINSDNPRIYGKPLKGNYDRYWRYRIGDYRLICEIKDNDFTIIAINIGHRKSIYK